MPVMNMIPVLILQGNILNDFYFKRGIIKLLLNYKTNIYIM